MWRERRSNPPTCLNEGGLVLSCKLKVDADHAGDTVTRRSRSGFLVFLNCSLIYWTSKKQTSIESSFFGSEFITMKQCCEYVRGLRYKLRMMGIPYLIFRVTTNLFWQILQYLTRH